jgi:hypothetical protein
MGPAAVQSQPAAVWQPAERVADDGSRDESTSRRSSRATAPASPKVLPISLARLTTFGKFQGDVPGIHRSYKGASKVRVVFTAGAARLVVREGGLRQSGRLAWTSWRVSWAAEA